MWALITTIASSSVAFIDGTVVNVALPALRGSFRASVTDAQWVVESYCLLLGSLILVGGSLEDLFGCRLVFLFAVGLFTLASVACGISSNIREMILPRSIQGVGSALLVPGSLAIISFSFDKKGRGQAIGTWSGFTAITTALGTKRRSGDELRDWLRRVGRTLHSQDCNDRADSGSEAGITPADPRLEEPRCPTNLDRPISNNRWSSPPIFCMRADMSS